MKNVSVSSFPLKIVIDMEQTGSGTQEYAGLHLMELSGFVAPIYIPGFFQDGWEDVL